MKLTVYASRGREEQTNTLYPDKVEVDLSKPIDPAAFSHDYVGSSFRGGKRSNDGFLGADCMVVDIDNSHSEREGDWVTEDDVERAFSGVAHLIHFSRSHMKEKRTTKANGTTVVKPARPKMHVILAIKPVGDAEGFRKLAQRLSRAFPFVDQKAQDPAHFFFGTENPSVKAFDGPQTLDDLLDEMDFDAAGKAPSVIEEGGRNNHMYRYGIKVLKRHGDSETARSLFEEESGKCEPPLPEFELEQCWKSALSFYKKAIVADPNYKAPEDFEDDNDYRPTDYSDVAQARLIDKYFSDRLRYSAATLNVVYRKGKWVESESGAQAVAQELTERQLRQADRMVAAAYRKVKDLGALNVLGLTGKKRSEAMEGLSQEAIDACREYGEGQMLRDYAVKRRFSHAITAALKEARPMVEIESSELDADPFLLNTPQGTIDLRKGNAGMREHSASDLITKMTSVSPSLKGKKMWEDCIDKIFGGNEALIAYIQEMCGLTLIGKVYVEAMIIAYGEGGNGKSTFFNTIAAVLGDYYGSLASDVLTTGIKRDKQADLAELRGKRLVIAAETKAGDRLDESTVKRMCSTDRISACKKYKDPFDFVPSHTLVIYTNNLPKVATGDDGTWRRLIVIPFKHKFTGSEDVKNYSETLVAEAGEYVLHWLIEGAKKAIDHRYAIEPPSEVSEAIKGYREANDWFHQFLDAKCDVSDPKATCLSSELYGAYRAHCGACFERIRSTTDFYAALARNGFERVEIKRKSYVKGIRLAQSDPAEFEAETDYLLS